MKALGCSMVYAELEPGVRVVAVEGSTVGATEQEIESGREETVFTIRPPEWNNTQAAACASGESFGLLLSWRCSSAYNEHQPSGFQYVVRTTYSY